MFPLIPKCHDTSADLWGLVRACCRVFSLFLPISALFSPLLTIEVGLCLQCVSGMCWENQASISYLTGNHILCYRDPKLNQQQPRNTMWCCVYECCISQFILSGFHHRLAAVHSSYALWNKICLCSCRDNIAFFLVVKCSVFYCIILMCLFAYCSFVYFRMKTIFHWPKYVLWSFMYICTFKKNVDVCII